MCQLIFRLVQLVIASSFLITCQTISAETLNPNFFYLVSGQPIGARSIQLGDPGNWSQTVENREGKSKNGKIAIAPADFKGTGDAIQITWGRKKETGVFAIYGPAMNLSEIKDAVSLTIDMKVDKRPTTNVSIGMDCGYPCRAQIPVKKMLTEFPTGEWFSLPIPLNCFEGEDFDLSKINGPITISTEGKLTLTIAHVRLERLAEGETGCKK